MKISKLKKKEFFWLKDSDFYRNIDQDGNEQIDIIYCSIFEKDPIKILNVINIWGVNFIPRKLLFTIFNYSKKLKVLKKLKDLYENTNYDLYKFFIDFIEKKIDDPLNLSVEKGFLDLLIYFHKIKYIWNENTCELAAENGKLECLKYLHENGCNWDSYTCKLAAKNGHLECLKYAHENGCDWGIDTCYSAAENGHLKCLKYAHENGCHWDEYTCKYAAENGYLECLMYAHKNGCDWNEDIHYSGKSVCSYAA